MRPHLPKAELCSPGAADEGSVSVQSGGSCSPGLTHPASPKAGSDGFCRPGAQTKRAGLPLPLPGVGFRMKCDVCSWALQKPWCGARGAMCTGRASSLCPSLLIHGQALACLLGPLPASEPLAMAPALLTWAGAAKEVAFWELRFQGERKGGWEWFLLPLCNPAAGRGTPGCIELMPGPSLRGLLALLPLPDSLRSPSLLTWAPLRTIFIIILFIGCTGVLFHHFRFLTPLLSKTTGNVLTESAPRVWFSRENARALLKPGWPWGRKRREASRLMLREPCCIMVKNPACQQASSCDIWGSSTCVLAFEVTVGNKVDPPLLFMDLELSGGDGLKQTITERDP